MVFSSTLFLLYFLPAFLAVYLLTPVRHRNWTALIASIGFYAWGAPAFVFVIIASLLADYAIVGRMAGQEGGARRRWLWASVVLNVGMLGYFKYTNFLVENLNALLHPFGIAPAQWAEVALPIGISFFTFQKLSYAVDVYRGGERPLQRFRDYVLYIMLFPQLIAGPIVRYSEIADRLTDRAFHETVDNRLLGFFRFCIGLARKVWVANALGAVADDVFALRGDELTFSLAWVGIVAYSFQIYFDFSGYSDMAIGLGQMMGFRFPENFNNPYAATSITDFWRRWHITLSNWMRDYLYIPLGGNRVGNARLYANLWAVFLISGLWHGAAWTFVLWGAHHGLFLVADRLFLVSVLKKVGKIPATLITYVIVLFGWVLFRADDAGHAIGFASRMLDFGQGWHMPNFSNDFWAMLALATSICIIGALPAMQRLQQRFIVRESTTVAQALLLTVVSALLLVLCASMVVADGFNPFIYFRF
jgi:alginate O-acetyltransferase complex protein AlgI